VSPHRVKENTETPKGKGIKTLTNTHTHSLKKGVDFSPFVIYNCR